MKYILIVGDGMADLPVDALGGKTPLEAVDAPGLARIWQLYTTHLPPPPHTHTHTHTHTHGRTLSTHATPPGHVTDTPHMPHPPPHPAPLCVFLSPLFLLPSSVVVPLPLAPLPPPSQDRVPLR